MRILITGGAGYIGTHTCVELLAAGHDIVVIDDFSNSSPRALERVRRLSGADFPCFRLNVRNRDALDRVFASYPVDAVIPVSYTHLDVYKRQRWTRFATALPRWTQSSTSRGCAMENTIMSKMK